MEIVKMTCVNKECDGRNYYWVRREAKYCPHCGQKLVPRDGVKIVDTNMKCTLIYSGKGRIRLAIDASNDKEALVLAELLKPKYAISVYSTSTTTGLPGIRNVVLEATERLKRVGIPAKTCADEICEYCKSPLVKAIVCELGVTFNV